MSLLTPEKAPVKVYKWDDAGAPILDKTANCVASIFKACLVTGYGAKSGAGWTAPFGAAVSGVQVFRPEASPHIDFYLRLSLDTGAQITPQVFIGMTDANTGELKLQCSTSFKYGMAPTVSGKWLLVASTRGVWFFCEQRASGDTSKTGAYFFAGDLQSDVSGNRSVYLQHSGGSNNAGQLSSIMGFYVNSIVKNSNIYLDGVVLSPAGSVSSTSPISFADGSTALTTDSAVSPMLVIANAKASLLPGMFIPFSGSTNRNFDKISIGSSGGIINGVVFGTGSQGSSNFYISTDYWDY